MAGDLVSQAREGDDDAFRALTEPHRRELHVHCYRMLGSVEDAEDVLQESLLAAWRGLATYEERASLRTWLYRIATNRCLNALRDAQRRPAKAWDVAAFDPPEPSRFGEVPWLEPLPNVLLEGAIDVPLGPEARYDQRESISLAFVTALQLLPPRQTAVVVLRDVLGFPADEVAVMLDSTTSSVTSALRRARATLRRNTHDLDDPLGRARLAAVVAGASERALVDRFARAYEAGDVDALVALLTDDVLITMPPLPHEYVGRDRAARFCELALGNRRFVLVPTGANGQPAFGLYVRGPSTVARGTGLMVLELSGDRIGALTRFETTVFRRFGLPPTWPPN